MQIIISGSLQFELCSESKGLDVDFGFYDNNDDWDYDCQCGGRGVCEGDLFGSWMLGQENGSMCIIELKSIEWFGGYSVYVFIGCLDGFFLVNCWVLLGNQLLFIDISNMVFGCFCVLGGGCWFGFCEFDGVWLYFNLKGC